MPYSREVYKHVKEIGEGYFCIVHEIERLSDNIHFAHKKLLHQHESNQDYQHRLKREIELVIELQDCENIISVVADSYSLDEEDLWYIMPLAETNLFNYIKKKNSSLSDEERFSIIKQVLTAVVFAHSKEILHRDISPNNVLVFGQNEANPKFVLSDFGLGKDSTALSKFTTTGKNGYGTAYYVSPEQKNDMKNATMKSDIYSIGKLMFFIMTGKDPTDKFDCAISNIIHRCIHEDPSKRYEDIKAVVEHFTRMVDRDEFRDFPVETTTVAVYLANVKEISWDVFHSIAIRGLYYSHPFIDYVESVVNLFNKHEPEFVHYYEHVGSDIARFVTTLMYILDDLDKRLGWPFTFLDDIGKLLAKIIKTVEEMDLKIMCLDRLWLIGFVSDQWRVQDRLLDLLESGIPHELEKQFIQTILEIPTVLNVLKINSHNIKQYQIKQAILECHSLGTSQEEERKREREMYYYI